MTKTTLSRALIGLSLAVIGFQSCSPAFAVPDGGNGNWKAHQCGGASALFTPPLKNAQSKIGPATSDNGTRACGRGSCPS